MQNLLQALGSLWRQNPREKVAIFATYLGTVDLLQRQIEETYPGQGWLSSAEESRPRTAAHPPGTRLGPLPTSAPAWSGSCGSCRAPTASGARTLALEDSSRLLREHLEPMLHRELNHRGRMDKVQGFSAKLTGWVQVAQHGG